MGRPSGFLETRGAAMHAFSFTTCKLTLTAPALAPCAGAKGRRNQSDREKGAGRACVRKEMVKRVLLADYPGTRCRLDSWWTPVGLAGAPAELPTNLHYCVTALLQLTTDGTNGDDRQLLRLVPPPPPLVHFLHFISLLVHVSPPCASLPCHASFAAGGEFGWARVVLAARAPAA